MKRTVKTDIQTAETAIPPSNQVGQTSRLSQPAKIGLITLASITLVGGILYSRFWPIAVVNGHIISRLEYFQTLDEQAGKQTLDNMITEFLILNEANRNGVTVPPAEITASMNELESTIKAQGQTLEQALTAEGVTKSQLEYKMKIQKLVEIMGKGNVAVTDQQISDYIAKNKTILPSNMKVDEIKTMVKSQLEQQATSDNIRAWLANIRKSAQIEYR